MSAAVLAGGALQMPQAHEEEDPRPTLLVTTVDIGGGRSGRIELRVGDDPREAARAFCARHGLPESIVEPLTQHIWENLEAGPAGEAYGEEELQSVDEPGAHLQQESEDELHNAEAAATVHARHLPQGLPSSIAPGLPGKAAAAAARGVAPTPHHTLLVDRSAQSAGHLGARPGSAAAAPDDAFAAPAPLSYRPASVNSTLGANWASGPLSSRRAAAAAQGHAYESGVGGAPAHHRLYADYFKQQSRLAEERRLRDLEIQLKTGQVHVTSVSQQLAAHRTAGSYSNYGERLYVEGRLDALKKEQLAQRVREEEQAAELAQYTFHPEISKMAQTIKSKQQGERDGAASAAYWDRLYQRRSRVAGKHQDRMESIRREQAEAEVKECSFRPRINGRSMRMVQEKHRILKESGISPYEALFNEGARRRQKLDALAALPPEDATFHPTINTSSVALRKLLEGRQQQQEDGEGSELGSIAGGGEDVADRLLERGRQYGQKLQRAREALEHPLDPATGQPLFRPQTCRAPRFSRNPQGAPVGEYLYSIKADWDERAQHVKEASQQRAAADASSTFVNSRSEKMVERLKQERFSAIYQYLCRSEPTPTLNLLETTQDEGFMDTIDPEVRADIEFAARLLARAIARRTGTDAALADSAASEPQESARSSLAAASYAQSTGGEVDQAAFSVLMEEVLERTKGLGRQYLLPMPSGRKKFENPSHQPTIDPHSQLIAARKRPDNLPVHELLYRTAGQISAKHDDMRKQMEERQLAECSFRPTMLAALKGKEGRALRSASRSAPHSRHASCGGEEPPQLQKQQQGTPPGSKAAPRGGGGSSQEVVRLDALEQEIEAAIVRLSMSDAQLAGVLAEGKEVAASDGHQTAEKPWQSQQQYQVASEGLDLQALFDAPEPSDPQSDYASAVGGRSTPAPAGRYNSAAATGGDSPTSRTLAAGVEWVDSEEHLVAELAGLDLHALASAGMPEAAGSEAAAGDQAAQGAAAAPAQQQQVPASPALSAA